MPAFSGLGDPPEQLKLERLNAAMDWEIFRPDLERIDQKVRKSAACHRTGTAPAWGAA